MPGSETVSNGQKLHTEVRRVFGYDKQTQNEDRIDVYICDDSGKVVAGHPYNRGTTEYEKYLPIANSLATELDQTMYADVFKDRPLDSVLDTP